MTRVAYCLWLPMLLAVGCDRPAAGPVGGPSSRASESSAQTPVVLVSILPQTWLVQRIAGSAVAVEAVIARGGSEHTYEPSPQQVIGFGRAKVYFSIGVAAEEAILRRLRETNPGVRIVDSAAGLPRRSMSSDVGLEGAHDHAGHDHDHSGDDPHTWLDPTLAARQAVVIAGTLAELMPDRADTFRANADQVKVDLTKLDEELAALLAPHKGREVFVYHPSFGYFLDRYGLRQSPVEFEGKEPTPKLLTALVDRAKKAGTKVIFVQPQFAVAPAEALAKAIGGRTESIDPLSPDYDTNLREMAGKIDAALRP